MSQSTSEDEHPFQKFIQEHIIADCGFLYYATA